MNQDWRKLPQIRNDKLIFMDTSGYPLPGKIVPCLLCTEPFLMRKFSGEPDQLCPECRRTYDECAVVICVRCQITICRLKPAVLDNGYVVKPRVVLHSNQCNICAPGLRESHIVEVEQWEKLVRPKKVILVSSKYT